VDKVGDHPSSVVREAFVMTSSSSVFLMVLLALSLSPLPALSDALQGPEARHGPASVFAEASGAIKLDDYVAAEGGDDCRGFQKAVSEGAGKKILLPPRKILLGSVAAPCQITIAMAVSIVGTLWQENQKLGSILVVNNPQKSPFLITGTLSRGTTFRDVSVEQVQAPPTAQNWTPIQYPPFFDIVDTYGEIRFENVFAAPAYFLIRSRKSGRLFVDGLRGQILQTGFDIDESLDVARITDVHFWNYWTSSPNVTRWQQENLNVFVFGRVSHPFIDRVFAFAAHSLLHVVAGSDGSLGNLQAGALSCDFCALGLWIEGNNVTGQIGSFVWQGEKIPARSGPIEGSRAILLTGSRAVLVIGALFTDRSDAGPIELTGSRNVVDIGSGLFIRPSLQVAGAPIVKNTGNDNKVSFSLRPAVRGIEAPLTDGNAFTVNAEQRVPQGAKNWAILEAAEAGKPVTVGALGEKDISIGINAVGEGRALLSTNGRAALAAENKAGDAALLVSSERKGITIRPEGGPLDADITIAPAGAGVVEIRNFAIGTPPPPQSNAACNPGQIATDASYIYVCVGRNLWKRSPLAGW
jgi:hypothetical protein